jgi:hypothetical protein
MKQMVALLLLAATAFFSCQNAGNASGHEHHGTQGGNADDSLYNQVMALHDEVMPKMGQLMGLQKRAQALADSLTAINTPESKASAASMLKLKDLLAEAEKGMDDWMVQFDADANQLTGEAKTAYFIDQRNKAAQMRDNILAALDSAKRITGQ